MKFTLGAIALALAAPAAFAQSSVTIYGIIDLDGQYLSGHTKDVLVTSGGQSGSRIGFKGTEDLGSGYYTDFVLEGGLNVDTGGSAQGGALFGRQAFGALRTPFGTASAGRQYSSIYFQTGDFSEFSNVSVGATTAVIGGWAGGYEPIRGSANNTTTSTATGSELNGSPARVNNSFRYTTPTFEGLKASFLYGAGEVTGGTTSTRLFDYSLRYTNYGVDAYVSYVSDKAQNGTNVLNSRTDVGIITASAAYTIGAFKVEGGYLSANDKRPADQDGHGFWLGGDYKFGQNVVRTQWVQNNPNHNNTGLGKTNAFGVGYEYDFSKRTNLYTSLTRFDNDASADGKFVGRIGGATPAGLTTTTDRSVNEFVLGVRHAF
ncbi:porin [Scleromatobacter humisilvae]|uniref:Porin n=1 Tax=Scleromatobacter humisilvae TaxID=2897159 RepID=A0A9X1YNC0_9BURK|nr:porin [Scleromatobacter humisilvae]MCK9689363.1 porin [Scleromatobacter humisilvae]